MTDVTVPAAPALVTVPNVELMHTGTWNISTGVATFTTEDLAAAVAALDCPAVRRPVLKLGHDEPDPDKQKKRWDGEPAVGYITNMAVAEDGRTLVGDYAGMPAWLGNGVLASAYPDRSIEGAHHFRCQMGHDHAFVVTAVALLGVTPPGIGTLQSLQDVAALYGVAAAAEHPADATPVTITIRAAREARVPDPIKVSAAVTTEDVRRAFYSSDYGKGWDKWIEEMQLGPDVQLIVMDDASGTRSRVPVTVGDGDGEEAVTFAEPVAVVVRYEDAPKVAAAAGARWVAWASKAESRPDAPADPADPPADGTDPTKTEGAASVQPPPEQTPVTDPVSGPTTKERLDMEFSDEQLAALRAKLGLPEDATLDPTALVDGIEKLTASSGDGSPGKTTTTKAAPGTVTVDQQVWDDMQTRINRLEQIRASQERSNRERAVDDAIAAGKFAPSRREHWLRVYEADPEGTTNLLAGLTPGQVPTSDYGMPGVGDGPDLLDAEFAHIFPAERNGA